jgi:hypothetical protein
MSAREIDAGRSAEPGEVRGTLSLTSAAQLLRVSYRQAKRLARRYRAEGAGTTASESNQARPPAERKRVLVLVREKYSGTIDVRLGRRWR